MSYCLRCAIFITAVLFLPAIAVSAPDDVSKPTLPEIHEQQTELRVDVVAGKGQFKDMSNQDRVALAKQQDEVLGLIDGKESLDELNDVEKVRAFNLLESIKATIVKNDDDRVICERYRPVGSNRVERACATVAERRKIQEASATALPDRALCNGIERCKYY